MKRPRHKPTFIDPSLPPEEYDRQAIARLEQRTIKTDSGCWEWQGFVHKPPRAYGDTSYRGKSWRTHRLMYFLHHGPIAPKIEICHSCDNQRCINPAHLWAGTKFDNMRDCGQKKRWPRQYRATCAQGHLRTPETMVYHGKTKKLNCRICLSERGKKRWREYSEDQRAKLRARRTYARQRRMATASSDTRTTNP